METRSFVVGESGESCCSISFADAQSIALSLASREADAQRKTNSNSQGHAERKINSGSEAHDETTGGKSHEHAAATAN